MVICQVCQAKQFQGTVFCSECGASLGELPPALHTPETRGTAVVEPVSGFAFALIVHSNGQRLSLTVQEDLLIGRRDDARGIIPDVDLSPYGGFDAGVSRRHAILSYQQSRYWLEDLGSANGTFLNEQRLLPDSPAALSDGDTIKLGMLVLRVAIKS